MNKIYSLLLFIPFWAQAQTPTVMFQTSAVSLEEGGGAEQVTLLISPAPAANESITLQIDLNGYVQAGDLYTTPEHTQGTLVLEVPAGSGQVSFSIGATGPDEAEGTELTTITISEVSSGLAIGQPSTINIGISEPPMALPTLFINEIQAMNTMTIADPNGEYDDWIEIYNSGSQDVDLAGMYISDDRNNSYKYAFPFSVIETTVPSGGYKIIWADSTPDQGALHTNFILQDDAGWLGLYYSGGAGGAQFRLIDSISYHNPGVGFSSGRQTDGGMPWVDFELPTPGASNQTTSIADHQRNFILLYPNPLRAGTSLMMSFLPNTPLNLKLISPDGRVVLQKMLRPGQQMVETDPNMASGLYILQLNGLNLQASQRLLIIP